MLGGGGFFQAISGFGGTLSEAASLHPTKSYFRALRIAPTWNHRGHKAPSLWRMNMNRRDPIGFMLWYIYLIPRFYSNIYYKNQLNVGKYTIYMDPMGLVEVAVFFFLLNPCDLPTFTLNMNQSCRQFNLKINQSCRQIYQSHGSYG